MYFCQQRVTRYSLCEKDTSPEKASTSFLAFRISRRRELQHSKPIMSLGRNLTSVVCPFMHWTRSFLACDERSACLQKENVLQESGRSIEKSLTSLCQSPLSTLFTCRTGEERVSYSLVCDHRQDCLDGSDEDFCVYPSCFIADQFECFNEQVGLAESK